MEPKEFAQEFTEIWIKLTSKEIMETLRSVLVLVRQRANELKNMFAPFDAKRPLVLTEVTSINLPDGTVNKFLPWLTYEFEPTFKNVSRNRMAIKRMFQVFKRNGWNLKGFKEVDINLPDIWFSINKKERLDNKGFFILKAIVGTNPKWESRFGISDEFIEYLPLHTNPFPIIAKRFGVDLSNYSKITIVDKRSVEEIVDYYCDLAGPLASTIAIKAGYSKIANEREIKILLDRYIPKFRIQLINAANDLIKRYKVL